MGSTRVTAGRGVVVRGTDTLVISKASANHELVISKVAGRLAVGHWPLAGVAKAKARREMINGPNKLITKH